MRNEFEREKKTKQIHMENEQQQPQKKTVKEKPNKWICISYFNSIQSKTDFCFATN